VAIVTVNFDSASGKPTTAISKRSMTLEEFLKLPDVEPERELVDGSVLAGVELGRAGAFRGLGP
jgi:hypothetical protein